MIRRLRVAASLLCLLALAACAAPMSQREAIARANRSLRSFCAQSPCGAVKLMRAQKLKNRWMVDFDAPGGIYTVAVDRGGAANVSVWDKNQLR